MLLKGVHAGAVLTAMSSPGSWRKKLSDRNYPEFWFAGRENVTPLLACFNELCQQPEVRAQTDPVIMRSTTLPPPSPRGLASHEAAAPASRRLNAGQDKNETTDFKSHWKTENAPECARVFLLDFSITKQEKSG